SRRRHTRWPRDWSSDVCSSDLESFPARHGRAGQRWVHMSSDMSVAFREILSGRLSLRDYWRSLRRPLESAIFAWDDPLPGLLDLPLFAGTLSKRVLQGRKT